MEKKYKRANRMECGGSCVGVPLNVPLVYVEPVILFLLP